MSWHLGALTGVDFETTGVDPQTDRIVSAAVVTCGEVRRDVTATTWLADPGIEIPAGAAAVHGITTEQARRNGRPAAAVVSEVVAALATAVTAGMPIVAMNAAFDLTMLEREAERYGLAGLFGQVTPYVIDPMVLDRQLDKYKPGRRTLTDLCRVYGVPLNGAHAADADAIAACKVARRIGSRYTQVGESEPRELHELQTGWARELAEDRAAYFRRTPGKEHLADGVRGEWPLVPAPREGGDA
ncbi:exonuclease domain-containing protein [Streptomyces sp. NPDC058424]|uniref:exonuclease domain-containing protein n=1 Tax=Streptomyces sp. NPDC058424 TaxID=3346491 RepID=UPI003663B2FD